MQLAEQKRLAKEARKSDLKLQAFKWLSGVSNYIQLCEEQQSKADAADKIEESIRESFAAKFRAHKDALKTLRSSIEEQIHGGKSDLRDSLVEAEADVMKVKGDIKTFECLYRSFYKKQTRAMV